MSERRTPPLTTRYRTRARFGHGNSRGQSALPTLPPMDRLRTKCTAFLRASNARLRLHLVQNALAFGVAESLSLVLKNTSVFCSKPSAAAFVSESRGRGHDEAGGNRVDDVYAGAKPERAAVGKW